MSEPEARDKVLAELAEVAGGGPVGPEHWSRLRTPVDYGAVVRHLVVADGLR